MQYHAVRVLGVGPDGPVEEVAPDRLGAAPLARRRAPVPAGPRRHRLRDVGESLARLGHPGIATVVDLVEVDDDVVQVLSELGDDGSLADRVASGPLPAAEVLDLLRQLAEALGAAHRAGVAHGHVAATNVVLRRGAAVLTDFGVTEARTGRPAALPFRDDVQQLAALGAGLLDETDTSAIAGVLRPLLRRVADDPDATLADLRAGLDRADGGAPAPPPRPTPTAEPAVEPPPTSETSVRGAPVLAAVALLLAGLLAGAAWTLLSDDATVEIADPAVCEPLAADLHADVDGDGCDEPLEWRAEVAEVAYPAEDGTLLRFRVGRPGDELAVGDWDCDGTDTAAVVRPATGETFLFDAWATEGQTLVAEVGPDLPAGTVASVVPDGACDRIRPGRT